MYVLAKKFGNDKISGKDGFSEVPKLLFAKFWANFFSAIAMFFALGVPCKLDSEKFPNFVATTPRIIWF